MFLARVTGTVVSTVKDDALRARKLLLLRQLSATGAALPRTLVALDAVGAGVGEVVYCCRGKEASFAFTGSDGKPQAVPTDATVVGIADATANSFIAPIKERP